MTFRNASFLLGILLLLVSFSTISEADKILRKSEEIMKGSTLYAEMDVKIERPRWNKTISIKSWIKNNDKALALITAPEKEAGTIFLKDGKQVWNYLPKVKKFIRLPASMMSQSWMGTDLTNDDLMKQSSILDDYEAQLQGSEKVNDVMCYKILLTPNEDAAVVWGKVIIWVGKEHYIQWKTEFYDEDEDLINTLQGYNLTVLGNRKLASKYVMTPADKENFKTTVVSRKLTFNAPISDAFFTTTEAKKLKP